MAHFLPMKGTPSAMETATIFIKEIIRLHGVPTNIVSDRGVQFTSRFWKALCSSLEIKLEFSSAYHPQMGKLKGRIRPWNNISAVSLHSPRTTGPPCFPSQSSPTITHCTQLPTNHHSMLIMASIYPSCLGQYPSAPSLQCPKPWTFFQQTINYCRIPWLRKITRGCSTGRGVESLSWNLATQSGYPPLT